MSRHRSDEIEALRLASEQYQAQARLIATICRNNPRGLRLPPMFGQRATRRRSRCQVEPQSRPTATCP